MNRYPYQKPKPKFGEILNANLIISRDINKDLMTHTQKQSEVRSLSKQYFFKSPLMISNNFNKVTQRR